MALPTTLMPGSYTIPGTHTIQLRATDGDPASFTITTTALAVPKSLILTPAAITVPDNATLGTKICSAAVTTSDGSPFSGALAVNGAGMIGFSGANLLLTRALATSDDGPHTFSVTATQNGGSLSASLSLTISAAAPGSPTVRINGGAGPVSVPAGSAITATVAGGPGNPDDWLGVYAAGSPSGPGDPASWKWLSTDGASGSIPATGVTAGTVHLVVPAQAGQYEVRLFAHSRFDVAAVSSPITAQAAAPGSPTVRINGGAGPVSVPAGSAITATVAGGPGNPDDWLGVYAAGSPSGPGDPASWKWLSTDGASGSIPATGVTAGTVHLVVPAQAGKYEVRLFAHSRFDVAAVSSPITAQAAAPVPTSVTLSPSSVSLPDNSPSATSVSKVAVVMSDSSAFTGTLSISTNNMVALSGSALSLSRALTPADDGAHTFTITATQNAKTITGDLTLNVTAVAAPPKPVISIDPVAPQIPDTSPKGAVVATYTITMSDGSPFTGTVAFGPPNFDNNGAFALSPKTPSTGSIIVNPAGSGVGPNVATITDHITLLANSP